MHRSAYFISLLSLLFLQQCNAEEWKCDILRLKSGQSFSGLILKETPERVVLQWIICKPGVRTVTREMDFDLTEIDRIERINDQDRTVLVQKLALLDEYGEQEKLRAQAVKLIRKPWSEASQQSWYYTGKYFEITTNAEEELVRLTVVRLEEVFAAYVFNLGVRHQPKERIKAILYRSIQEYQQWQQRRGSALLNTAYYDADRNEIHLASDLERLAGELAKVRQKHEEKLRELAEHERKLRNHYHGKPPAASLTQLRGLRRQLQTLNHDNDATLERLRGIFFATLYHEAFHAYLDAYVYPSGAVHVPRWLNEGLAQIFETALVETGELRVGHIDSARLAAVKSAVKQKQLVPLRELLRSTPKDFTIGHASEVWASDRFFLTSWALAYYLTFERKLLGKDALHQYVEMHIGDTDKIQLFERLIGKPVDEVEKEFHSYLLQLRPDGTLHKAQ